MIPFTVASPTFRLAGAMETDLVALAGRQHGYFTWNQALAHGMSAKQLATRVAGRGWEKVHPRVYRLPGAARDAAGSMMAVQLWMGTDGHFTGRTAAHLFGLPGIESPAPITIVRVSSARLPGVVIRRVRAEDRPATRWVRGFRVAQVDRVIVDLCATESKRTVGRALDDIIRRGFTTLERLQGQLARGRGRKGSELLRTLLLDRDAADAAVRSEFEAKMLRIVRRLGVGFIPDFKVEIGNRRFYLDFYVPSARLGIECHSIAWHGPAKHSADAERHRLLSGEGIEILYFTWDDVATRPQQVEDDLRAALIRRELRLPTGPHGA